jgi:hypothetical protein
MGKFGIGHKKTYDFLLVIKKFNFPIDHWVEILFLLAILVLKLDNKCHICR